MSLELIIAIAGITLVPAVGYVVTFVNKLSKRVDDIEKELIKHKAESDKGDEKIKNHILNCVNYKPRHELKD